MFNLHVFNLHRSTSAPSESSFDFVVASLTSGRRRSRFDDPVAVPSERRAPSVPTVGEAEM